MLNRNIKKLGEYIRSKVEIWVEGNPDIQFYDLCGACAIASYTMYRCLIKLGYKPQFIMASSDDGDHCWVTLDDFIIDLTATQFNNSLPPVLITHKKYYTTAIPELQKYNVIANNLKAIKKTQVWDQQSPIIYKSKIRNLIKNLNVELYK